MATDDGRMGRVSQSHLQLTETSKVVTNLVRYFEVFVMKSSINVTEGGWQNARATMGVASRQEPLDSAKIKSFGITDGALERRFSVKGLPLSAARWRSLAVRVPLLRFQF